MIFLLKYVYCIIKVSNAALKADMDANDSRSLDEDTVLSYVNALKKIFVVEDLPAVSYGVVRYRKLCISAKRRSICCSDRMS